MNPIPEYFQAKCIEQDDTKEKVLHEVSYVVNGVDRTMIVTAKCPVTAIDTVRQYLGV